MLRGLYKDVSKDWHACIHGYQEYNKEFSTYKEACSPSEDRPIMQHSVLHFASFSADTIAKAAPPCII